MNNNQTNEFETNEPDISAGSSDIKSMNILKKNLSIKISKFFKIFFLIF